MLMLEKVRYFDYQKEVDVEAFTDGYAYDRYSHLYLMSVAGYEARVKAITSALVTGREIQVIREDTFLLSQDWSQRYRILSTKLDNNLLHQLVLADCFLKSSNNGNKLLYIDNEENAPELVYNTIKTAYPVPLIPEWSEWLYRKVMQENRLEELSGTRKVVRLSVSEQELDNFISEGIRNGEIEF